MDQQTRRDVADALLVIRAQLSEEKAFTELVHRYSTPLRGYLARLVDDSSADDVLQQVWIKAHRRLESLKDPQAFKAWLFAIARSSGIDAVRKQRSGRELSLDHTSAAPSSEEFERRVFGQQTDASPFSAPAPDPTAGLAINQALGRLSAPHRELLRLRFEFGLSYDELAATLNINKGTVRSRLHTSKARLRSLIKGESS